MIEGFRDSFGYRVHYVNWEGTGPKVILIHSMGMDAHSMEKLAESLKNECQVLSLTILGHGDSDTPNTHLPLQEHAEIIRNCYKQLDFYPSVLVGHSVGGMMGMILTAEHPEEFKGLVLVDIAPFEPRERPARPTPPAYFENEEKAREWLAETYPGFTDYYVENRLRHAFIRKEGKLWLKPRGDSIRSGSMINLWPYVERIRCPVLLLIGKESDLVSHETAEKMENKVPELQTVIVEGTGHMIPQDVPDKFEGLVKDFLNKINR